MGFQGDGLALEGGSVDNLAARAGISALESNQRFRVFQHPKLGADTLGHTGKSEIGAGGSIKKAEALTDLLLKFSG